MSVLLLAPFYTPSSVDLCMQLNQALFLLPVFYGFPALNNLMILIICGGGKQCWPEHAVASGCGLRKHVMNYRVTYKEHGSKVD